jgi:serine/threonine protein kinase
MVIPLLGCSLQMVTDNNKKSKSIHSLLFLKEISLQILFLIKSIHEKGLIHRDIKPDNFLFGKDNKLFLIDFGLCKFYLNNNNHIPLKKTSCLIGSVNYCSINSHKKLELSRRDDLISLGYIMIYLYYGRLEWSDININKDIEESNKKIIFLKKNILLFPTLPSFILTILEYSYALKFDQEPDYPFLIQLISDIV